MDRRAPPGGCEPPQARREGVDGLVQIFLPEPDVMQDPGEMEMKRPIPAFKEWLSDKWAIAVCEE
ncbi:hypothetical protein PRBEI_2001802400 [Prionailurus iriomotensis]